MKQIFGLVLTVLIGSFALAGLQNEANQAYAPVVIATPNPIQEKIERKHEACVIDYGRNMCDEKGNVFRPKGMDIKYYNWLLAWRAGKAQ